MEFEITSDLLRNERRRWENNKSSIWCTPQFVLLHSAFLAAQPEMLHAAEANLRNLQIELEEIQFQLHQKSKRIITLRTWNYYHYATREHAQLQFAIIFESSNSLSRSFGFVLALSLSLSLSLARLPVRSLLFLSPISSLVKLQSKTKCKTAYLQSWVTRRRKRGS